MMAISKELLGQLDEEKISFIQNKELEPVCSY